MEYGVGQDQECVLCFVKLLLDGFLVGCAAGSSKNDEEI